MNPNHALGNYWGPIEYRETGLFEIDQKLISKSDNKSMSYFSDFNHSTVSYAYRYRCLYHTV